MNIIDMLTKVQGGSAVDNLAKSFGLPPEKAEAALEAVVPQLGRAMERNTLNRGGIADLVATLGTGRPERYLEPDAKLDDPKLQSLGDQYLAEILGSKDRSRAVAAKVQRQTGVSEDVVKKMLPVIATMVLGGVAETARPALDDIASRFGGSPLPLPGERPALRQPPSGPAPAAQHPPTGGIGRQSPLPVPGDRIPEIGGDNPYGDLTDVIRRGRVKVPSAPDGGRGLPSTVGGSLDQVIRDILGGVLGFESKGFIGWVIRLIFVRYGWQILQAILRRVLGGR